MQPKTDRSNPLSATENPAALGKAIAKARRASGMTQQELCAKTGIAYSTLTKIERGAIKKPNVFTVLQIAQATNLKIEELLSGSRPKSFLSPHTIDSVNYANETEDNLIPKTSIKFIYFDLHQVLTNSCQGMLPFMAAFTNQPLAKVEGIFLRCDQDLCLGKLSQEEFSQILSDELGMSGLNQLDFYTRYAKADSTVREALDAVSQNCRIGLLTNAFPGNVSILLENGLLPRNFSVIVDSSEIGKIKPERDIYEYAQKEAGLKPEEILLVDDRLINILGAKACGWQGFWLNDESRPVIRERLQNLLGF